MSIGHIKGGDNTADACAISDSIQYRKYGLRSNTIRPP